MNAISLSVVIPCYNESESLKELVRRSVLAVSAIENDSYELILVDDGSDDGTWFEIIALRAQYPKIVAVKLSRNHGHQLALTAGLSVVRGETVFIIDADLQDPPELYSQMKEVMDSQCADVVYGQRVSRAGENRFKKVSASIFYRTLRKSSNFDLPLDAGDFRLMSRRMSDLIVEMPERDRFIRGMVAWLGFKQVPFLYERDERYAGDTKYSLRKMLRLATDAFMGFSMVPLRFAGQSAMLVLTIMFVFILYAFYSWIALDTVPGWTSIVIIVSFVGSIQMILLGIIGEYIGRLYIESKKRPLYVIESVERD